MPRKADGSYTEHDEEYWNSYLEPGRRFAALFNVGFGGFDPDFTFRDKEHGKSFTMPTDVVLRIVELTKDLEVPEYPEPKKEDPSAYLERWRSILNPSERPQSILPEGYEPIVGKFYVIQRDIFKDQFAMVIRILDSGDSEILGSQCIPDAIGKGIVWGEWADAKLLKTVWFSSEPDEGYNDIWEFDDLTDAVKHALSITQEGDTSIEYYKEII